MKGFFSKKDTQSLSRPDGRIYSCASCGLLKDATTPRIPLSGDFKRKILIVSHMPSRGDDRRGKAWQGTIGAFLERELGRLGVDLHRDCATTFALRCHSRKAVGSYEIACCRKNLLAVMQKLQPKAVLLLGVASVESVVGARTNEHISSMAKWRGWTIPDQEFTTWLCPLMHPSHVDNAKKEVQTVWRLDLERAISKASVPFLKHVEPTIHYLKEKELGVLDSITPKWAAFDYETTGLKPHASGHRIVCASIAVSENEVYTFMMPASRVDRSPFLRFLANPQIGKIAQNMKFEETWSSVRLRQPVANWGWDTMLATHMLDNRPGVTGLKFQTYVQFGITGYDDDVAPYLRAKDNKNGNAFNTVLELIKRPGGKASLLKYCAYDSIYEYRLALLQQKIMGF